MSDCVRNILFYGWAHYHLNVIDANQHFVCYENDEDRNLAHYQ